MENAVYVSITRQAGLLQEMQQVANNVANAATTGYRREGLVFSEFLRALPLEGGSLAMAYAHGRLTDTSQGALSETGNRFDFAIEGEGFFLIETPQGERLTRAGAFGPNANGELVDPGGNRLLDAGGAPVFVPPDAAGVSLAPDGTLSAGGAPLARIGVVTVADRTALVREGGTRFRADSGYLPADGARLHQGFLESSNVNPVSELARMIEVQRSYELGQTFLDREDERIRQVVRTLGQRP
ncbi:MAG: flagellar hook-basal body complex protein [Paracoccaceae bacterium]